MSIAFFHLSASGDFIAAINPGVSLVEGLSHAGTIVARGTVDNASVVRRTVGNASVVRRTEDNASVVRRTVDNASVVCRTEDNASVVLLNILKGKYGEVSEITPSATHLGIKWETLPTRDIKNSQPGYRLRKFSIY